MLQPAVEYVMEEWYVTSAALNIPNSFRVSAIAFGIFAMLSFIVAQAVKTSTLRDLVLSVVLVAAVAGAFWLLSPALLRLGNINILIFLVGVVALCLVMGVPIAFCFGIGTLAFLAFSTRVPIFVMIGRMDEGMSSIILLSVPIFVLSRLHARCDRHGQGHRRFPGLAPRPRARRHVLRAARLALPRLGHFRLEGVGHGDRRAGPVSGDEAARAPAAAR